MKPIDDKESQQRRRFNHPHDVWYNHDAGMRIAHKKWKRVRSKYLRKKNKRAGLVQLAEPLLGMQQT